MPHTCALWSPDFLLARLLQDFSSRVRVPPIPPEAGPRTSIHANGDRQIEEGKPAKWPRSNCGYKDKKREKATARFTSEIRYGAEGQDGQGPCVRARE